jgi:hypothetical protein
MWFQTQGEYLDKCTCDNKQETADMNERTKRDERCSLGMDRVVQSVCDDFDMVKWKGLDSELMVGWLEQIVREAYRKRLKTARGRRGHQAGRRIG